MMDLQTYGFDIFVGPLCIVRKMIKCSEIFYRREENKGK
jgi:hypothetical protein